MSKFNAGLGGNTGAIAAGAVVAIVLVVGVWIGKGRDAVEIIQPAALLQPSPGTVDAEAPTAPATADTNELPAPAFDEVRREPDGMTVVAGRAAAGATVQLLRDGEVIATATADSAGKFATLAMIAPDGQAHVLSLSQRLDGVDITSLDEIILAPTDKVVAVAEAAPQTIVVGQTGAAEEAPETDVAKATFEAVMTNATPEAPAAETIVAETVAAEAVNADTTDSVQTETALAGATPTASETPQANPVAVLKSTAAGVELLNPAAPTVMDTVALDTIGYSDTGDVQLSGRAQPDTDTVRVYLDNDAVISLPVDDQGRWRGEVPDVDEGIYTLRVDELAVDGTVTSRIETPFKRESAAVLTQATVNQDGPIKAITVQAGATLWAIARDRYGDGQLYVRVVEANAGDIRDPDLIYPGQVFDLPD